MSKLLKSQLKQRPTYETLVKDTILEPKDKIALPDRQATILRKTQQLSRYDDFEFIDLEKDHEKIAKEQAQQMNVKAAAGTIGSIAESRATQTGPHQGHTFASPPTPQPPSGGVPPRQSPTTSPQSFAPLFQTASSSSGPSQPTSMAPKVAAGRTASKAPVPEQFDITIDDAMDDAQAETDKVFEQMNREALEGIRIYAC